MQPPGHSVLWVDVPPPLGEPLAMEPYGETARQPLQGVIQSPGLALHMFPAAVMEKARRAEVHPSVAERVEEASVVAALAVPVAEAASVVPEVEVAEEADVNASSLRV